MKLLSTLGWVPEVVAYPANILKPDEMVVFVGAASQRDREIIDDSKERLKSMVVQPIKFVEVDPLDMGDCIVKMKPHLSDDSVVNITGGTKIMAFTLLLLATLRFGNSPRSDPRDLPVIYVKTVGSQMYIERLPLEMGAPEFNPRGNGTAALILKVLMDSEDGELSSPEIRRIMESKYNKKVQNSTFSEAKKKLENANLISVRWVGNTSFLRIHEAAEVLLGVGSHE